MRATNRSFLAVPLALLAGGACSLGLDESKLDVSDETGDGQFSPESGALDAGRADTGGEASAPIALPTTCQSDQDCSTKAACLSGSGRCDLPSHTCLFDVCKQPNACTRARCEGQGSKTCGAAEPLKFSAGRFRLGGALGCGDNKTQCFAAVYPFLFVGLTTGVFAYSLADPNPASVTPIPVTGAPVFPSWIVASGRRVYFVEDGVPIQGTSAPSKVRIAWVGDVPSNPFATRIVANTSFVTMPDVPQISFVFPAPNGGVALVSDIPAASYPTARAQQPAELSPLPSTQNMGWEGQPVAMSGDRLVAYIPGTAFRFGLENAAGTSFAGPSAALAIVGSGESLYVRPHPPQLPDPLPGALAQGPLGGLVWAVSVVDSARGSPSTHYASISWILPDGTSPIAAFSAATTANVETYTAPNEVQEVVGALAPLDANNVLVSVRKPGDDPSTRLRVAVLRQADGGSSIAVDPARRYDLDQPSVGLSRVGLAATNGFGYAIAIDSPPGDTTVHVIAPSCPVQ